ncbi:MAG: S41 family peptidase [Armatimonadetes bacterium]|nr:S41 family peptidase [Armatimonadota bacterium]
MAESEQRAQKSFPRTHAFVIAAAACFGFMMFVMGTEYGRRGPSGGPAHRLPAYRGDSLFSALTQPLGRVGSLDPDPLESFMEVYEQLKSKYLEEITEADKKKLSYGAVRGMLRELGDPYTRFMAPDDFSGFREENTGHFKGIGAVLGVDQRTNKIQVIQVFRDNPAERAGLRAGDYILAINNEKTDDLSLDVAVDRIRGPADSKVKLTIERPSGKEKTLDPELERRLGHDPNAPRTDPAPVTGKTQEIEITRADVSIPIVESDPIGDGLGYVSLRMFNEQSYTQLQKALDELQRKGVKGVVLDLRDDPGGMLEECVKVVSLFVSEGAVVHVQERGKAPETLSVISQYTRVPKLPLVVLVNHWSASASEILAGALQDHKRAKIVGDTTYGKGLVQTVVPLSDNSAVAITTAKYLTPDKRDINKKGIEPDIKVDFGLNEEQTRTAMASGKPAWEWDPQLMRAIDVLKAQLH